MQAGIAPDKRGDIFIFSVFILTLCKPLAFSNIITGQSVSWYQKVRLNDSVRVSENQSFVTFHAGREGQKGKATLYIARL